MYTSRCKQPTYAHKTLHSLVFERILNSLWLPYVSGYALTTILQARHILSFSKSTPPPYSYHTLVPILRTHHNPHAMPPRARSYHPALIQSQFHHSRPTPWYATNTFLLYTIGQVFLLGSPEDKFESLNEQFMESRESLFAYVESATAKFNKWTVESPPLLVVRLMSGIFGFLILIGIWSGW